MSKKGSLAGLINSNWQKTAGTVLVSGALRAGSAVGGFWLHKKLTTPKEGQTEAPSYAKFVGPGMLAAGLAGEVFFADPYLISISEGMTVAGGLLTAKSLLKEKAADFGLAGIGALTDGEVKPLPASVANFDFDKALQEAEALNDAPTSIPGSVNGIGDAEGDGDEGDGVGEVSATSMF